MTKTQKIDHGQENAKAWLGSIEEMLEAFNGWEAAARAEHWTGPHKDKFGGTYFECENDTPPATWACGSWKELCEAHDIEPGAANDEARETIEQSVLSVMVRDGWRQPGASQEDGPEEYEILLSTGGPALRIVGQLDQHNQPSSAELQHQDWGTPWTRFPAPEATLLAFASVFWFGE